MGSKVFEERTGAIGGFPFIILAGMFHGHDILLAAMLLKGTCEATKH